jgi:hypothetical protein
MQQRIIAAQVSSHGRRLVPLSPSAGARAAPASLAAGLSVGRQNVGVFRRQGRFVRVTMLGVVLALVAIAAGGTPASGDVGVACGPSTLATISTLDAKVASNVYLGELGGPGGAETKKDLGHITSAADLLAAVAADSRSATLEAVKRIVYHPFWHIVRLRVLDASGHLLADFGGPYVIAPVTGVLRAGGVVVGSFVMSVQDDLGFAKLEHRFVGDPIGIYVNGRLVVQQGATLPEIAPTGPEVTLGGVTYAAVTRTYNAFPSGKLSAVIAVAPPPLVLTEQSCPAVVVDEVGRVAERIATLFQPVLAARYAAFAQVVTAYTGATVVVRIGLRAIVGSEGLGPETLPTSGLVSYLSQNWMVFSFAPTPPARIYLLVAQT